MSVITGIVEQLLRVIEQLMPSPWIYLVVFLVIVVDSDVPLVPSGTALISAGVFAAAQENPNVALLIPIAIAAAIIGDHIAYALGRGRGATCTPSACAVAGSARWSGWNAACPSAACP